MKLVIVTAVVGGLALAACASETESKSEAESDGGTPQPTGSPVSADDFCPMLAEIACEASERCCESEPTSSDGGWPDSDELGADGGVGCEVEQLARCRGTLGKLIEDPRTGYDAARGGKVVAALASASQGCWKDPVTHADVLNAFLGSGEVGASCTPEDSSSGALQVSALSCKAGTSCRLYLKADGSPNGVCEERADESCSHPFDCAPGNWCDLPGGWKPGVWGECHPLRTDGWTCASDLECKSSHCDASGRCAPESDRRYCLQTPYASEIAADDPLVYLRFNDSTGKDASGNGNACSLMGDPTAADPGALAQDPDRALSFDGVDDRASVPAGAIGSQSTLTIELWVNLPEGLVSKPLLAFGGETEGGPVIDIDETGSLRVNFGDTDGKSHVLSSGENRPGHGSWHHVVATYDGLTAELYLDGKKVASLEEAFVPRTTGELHIGHASPGNYFAGAIDEVAIYGKALSPGRTLEHRAIGTKGPDRLWPLYAWFD